MRYSMRSMYVSNGGDRTSAAERLRVRAECEALGAECTKRLSGIDLRDTAKVQELLDWQQTELRRINEGKP